MFVLYVNVVKDGSMLITTICTIVLDKKESLMTRMWRRHHVPHAILQLHAIYREKVNDYSFLSTFLLVQLLL